jgi:hypothetical protein
MFLSVHGNAAISDNLAPVNIQMTDAASYITAPASVKSYPYRGKVHFVFQNPPMGPGVSFNITELHANIFSALVQFDQVDLCSGFNRIFSRATPQPPDTAITETTVRVDEEASTMDPKGGLCLTYTITFKQATSSINFGSVWIKYDP